MTTIDQCLTTDEEAILRSWLAGNRPGDIAKARRLPESGVQAVIRDLCDFQRDHARRILGTGARLPLPAQTSPAASGRVLAEAEQRIAELAAVVGDLRRQLAAAQTQLAGRPTPLREYGALWCRRCREVISTGHGHRDTAAVTIAVLPRGAG